MRSIALLGFAIALCSAGIARADDDGCGDAVDAPDTTPTVTESDGFVCPVVKGDTTPQQVIATRIAALEAGDINGVICTYAVGATVVMPGSVVTGRAAIKSSFLGFFGLLGNTVPNFTSQTFSGPIGLVTYTVNSPSVTVPDGADSYVIKHGRIQYQTVTASIQFTQ